MKQIVRNFSRAGHGKMLPMAWELASSERLTVSNADTDNELLSERGFESQTFLYLGTRNPFSMFNKKRTAEISLFIAFFIFVCSVCYMFI